MNTLNSCSFAGPIGFFSTNHCGEESQLQLSIKAGSAAKAARVEDFIASLPILGKKPDIILIEHANAHFDREKGQIVYDR